MEVPYPGDMEVLYPGDKDCGNDSDRFSNVLKVFSEGLSRLGTRQKSDDPS